MTAHIKKENGMWNVYFDGVLDNAFGAWSDAVRYVQLYNAKLVSTN